MEKQHLLNEEIKAQNVLLLDKEGEKMGNFPLKVALEKAYEQDMDLMLVNQNKDLTVCRIVNYSSWLYHENKKRQKQEFKNRAQELKSINFRPVTDENDFQLKLKKINEFLDDNHKVKIVIKLKSREGAMKSVNELVVQRIVDGLAEHGVVDGKVSWSFKEINFIVKPERKPVMKPKM